MCSEDKINNIVECKYFFVVYGDWWYIYIKYQQYFNKLFVSNNSLIFLILTNKLILTL